MATENVDFNPSGNPIKAEITCGFAQDGAYILTLWDGNQIVQRWEGNFLNTDDDAYVLPGPASSHDGRVLQCRAEVSIEPPIDDYSFKMTLTQDGAEIAVVEESGKAPLGSLKGVNLFARLAAR